MENTQNTQQNNLIKFSKKVFNFNVIVNHCGTFEAAQESGYKLNYNGVLLAIQKQNGTHEKIIIDLETGLIIFKIKNLKELTAAVLEKWIEKALPVKEKMKHTFKRGGVSDLEYYKNIVKNI